MSRALEKYLDRVMIYANRNEKDAAEIRAELEDHLLKKIADLETNGLSREDTVFQAIEEHGHPRTVGYGLRKRFSWVDVRTHGTARGFIAIGPKAIGVFAFGGAAFGLFAFGGFAVGLFAIGGLVLAAFFAGGGLCAALLGFAYGGVALGLVAFGGIACGLVATGGIAAGLWVPIAGQAFSYFMRATVPPYLGYLDRFGKAIMLLTTPIYLLTCLFLVLIQLIFTKRERRRIKKADPKLVE